MAKTDSSDARSALKLLKLVSNTKKPIRIKCPHCGSILVVVKKRKVFHIHKCLSKKCPYYLSRKKILPKNLSAEEKYEYKLHYIYREFTLDFFAMDPYSLPGNATTFQFKKFMELSYLTQLPQIMQ